MKGRVLWQTFKSLNLHRGPAGGDPTGKDRSRPMSTGSREPDSQPPRCLFDPNHGHHKPEPREDRARSERLPETCRGSSGGLSSRRSSPQTQKKTPLLGVGCCLSTKADCARPRPQTQFVSNHIWHCHHTVISCPDTNSTATRSRRSNRIFSERECGDTKALSRSPSPHLLFLCWGGLKLNFKRR